MAVSLFNVQFNHEITEFQSENPAAQKSLVNLIPPKTNSAKTNTSSASQSRYARKPNFRPKSSPIRVNRSVLGGGNAECADSPPSASSATQHLHQTHSLKRRIFGISGCDLCDHLAEVGEQAIPGGDAQPHDAITGGRREEALVKHNFPKQNVKKIKKNHSAPANRRRTQPTPSFAGGGASSLGRTVQSAATDTVKRVGSARIPATYQMGPGYFIEKSSDDVRADIDYEEFFAHRVTKRFEKIKTAIKSDQELLIADLEEQINTLTIYLEEERLNHRMTMEKDAKHLEKTIQSMNEERMRQLQEQSEAHANAISQLERSHAETVQQMKDESQHMQDQLNAQIETLRASFTVYQDNFNGELNTKLVQQSHEMEKQFESRLEKALSDLSSQETAEKNRDLKKKETEFEEKMTQMKEEHEAQIRILAKKCEEGEEAIVQLKQILDENTKLKKDKKKLKEEVKNLGELYYSSKKQLHAAEKESKRLQEELQTFIDRFDDKVRLVDEDYRERLEMLQKQTVDLRKAYMEKCEELVQERLKCEQTEQQRKQTAKEALREKILYQKLAKPQGIISNVLENVTSILIDEKDVEKPDKEDDDDDNHDVVLVDEEDLERKDTARNANRDEAASKKKAKKMSLEERLSQRLSDRDRGGQNDVETGGEQASRDKDGEKRVHSQPATMNSTRRMSAPENKEHADQTATTSAASQQVNSKRVTTTADEENEMSAAENLERLERIASENVSMARRKLSMIQLNSSSIVQETTNQQTQPHTENEKEGAGQQED